MNLEMKIEEYVAWSPAKIVFKIEEDQNTLDKIKTLGLPQTGVKTN